MQLPALLTSDLHLTANPRDEYRWRLFDFLEDQARVEDLETLCILGDLTDAKDYHPSSLTNRIVKEITRFSSQGIRVIILMGNHDYLRNGHAYFEFLNNIPGVTFVTKPWEDLSDGAATLWLPHTKTPAKDWEGIDTTHFNYIFMHQTVGGAVASNGQCMEGEGVPDLTAWGKVYSGDIHVPQVIKGVEYVGSPYHVHFGDSFDPRLVLLDRRGRPVDLAFGSPQRRTVTVTSTDQLRRLGLKQGDQVKVRIEIDHTEKHAWQRLRREAMDALTAEGVEVHGLEMRVPQELLFSTVERQQVERLSDADVVVEFVRSNDLGGDVLDVGLELVP